MTGTLLAFLVRLATGVRLLPDLPEDGKRRVYFANHGSHLDFMVIAPFKPGLHHLVTKCPEILLVPVFLENLSRILPKGELLPLPVMGQAVFGEPLPHPGEHESKADFLQRARQAVLELSHGNLSPSDDAGS